MEFFYFCTNMSFSFDFEIIVYVVKQVSVFSFENTFLLKLPCRNDYFLGKIVFYNY